MTPPATRAEHRRTTRAREVIAERAREAGVRFTPLEERGLLANLPTGEDGGLDEAAFTTSVDEAAARSPSPTAPAASAASAPTPPSSESSDEESKPRHRQGRAKAFGRSSVKEA